MSRTMRILASLVVIAIVAVGIGVFIIRGPGPLDFAGGTKVALADYHAGKPTGVPAKLEKASLVERGEYLAKAADCMVCHTTPGGREFTGGLGFKLPDRLPSLPRRPQALPFIEADAVAHRIDLQIARMELTALAKSLDLTTATRFVTLLDVAGIDRRTRDPESPAFRERGFDVLFQIPVFDGGEVRVRQATETYNLAFNRLTEKAVNVRSEARDAYRVYRSTYDIAGHYQREILPLRKIITEEMQLRFSSMQVDVFALLTEARQRLASLRAAIDARRAFFLAQAELQTAVNGGGSGARDNPTTTASAAPAASPAH